MYVSVISWYLNIIYLNFWLFFQIMVLYKDDC